MAAYSRQERTTTWVEYVLPNPTNWVEIQTVISALRAELGDRAQWDDVVTVHGEDDQIVLRYENAVVCERAQ